MSDTPRRPPVTGVAVVVPAHQEAELVEGCLRSLRSAARSSHVPVTVTVVADACTDATARLARRHASVVHVAARNVGVARGAGVREAVRRWSPHRRPGLWIATTDADSTVPADWITAQLDLARRGSELVAGRIVVTDWDDRPAAVDAAHRARYRDGPAHGHVHGANLGVALRLYTALGGFAPRPTGEDVDLVERAEAAGAAVTWSTSSPVHTSARRDGRAPAGFSDHLDALERSTLCTERLTSPGIA